MSNLFIFLIILPITGVISYFWVKGIDYMNTHHPNYKGYDFIRFEGEDEEEQ
jgi:hypothetical protein